MKILPDTNIFFNLSGKIDLIIMWLADLPITSVFFE
jgi:hypothetical protein